MGEERSEVRVHLGQLSWDVDVVRTAAGLAAVVEGVVVVGFAEDRCLCSGKGWET